MCPFVSSFTRDKKKKNPPPRPPHGKFSDPQSVGVSLYTFYERDREISKQRGKRGNVNTGSVGTSSSSKDKR